MEFFGGAYRGRAVLVTGHTGFKGSWLALWLSLMGARVIGFALAPPTTPNHFSLLDLDMASIEGDICDSQKIEDVLVVYKPEIIFHLAAQPLVRASYVDPAETYQTNLMGTLNLYEACRRRGESVKAIVCVTTDKVYENKEWNWGYRENDVLGGHDPYSASKVCAEILTASYRKSFFPIQSYGRRHQTLLATARAGNVVGGGDWSKDRLVPDIVKAAAVSEPVVIRNPNSVRPWQHVLESLSGYLLLGQKLLEGDQTAADSWNFGPASEEAVPVHHLVKVFQKNWAKLNYVCHEEPSWQFHESQNLTLDSAKARSCLQWLPVWGYEETIRRTVAWYRSYYEDGYLRSVDDISFYQSVAVERSASWAMA